MIILPKIPIFCQIGKLFFAFSISALSFRHDSMTLPEMLSKVDDPRSVHGLRFPLHNFLIMCIMAIMSGHYSYRGIGRFLKNNERDIRRIFGSYHGVPCYVTIRDVLQSIDFEVFSSAFNRWAKQYVPMCTPPKYASIT